MRYYLLIYYLRPLMPTEKQALAVGRRLKIYQDKQPRSKCWVTLIWPVAYWTFLKQNVAGKAAN